jgi:hypothetical protein
VRRSTRRRSWIPAFGRVTARREAEGAATFNFQRNDATTLRSINKDGPFAEA